MVAGTIWFLILTVNTIMTDTHSGTLEAVAGRLQKAMASSGMTITQLQEALDRAGVEGSKYSNVQRYVRGKGGKSPPSFDWLEGAADALGVEVGWLALGVGSMTWGETATDEQRAALSEGLWSDQLTDHIAQRLAPGEPVAAAAFWKVLRLVVRAQKEHGAQDPDVEQLAKDVGAVVGEATGIVSLCKPANSRLVLLQDDVANLETSILHAIAVAIQARASYELG